MNYTIAIVASVAFSLSAREASAQIAFEHHYISTTYPKLPGFGQSAAGDFNNDGRTDYLIGLHFGTREKRQYLFINNGTKQTRIGPAVHSGMWPAGIGDGDMDVFSRAWYENADGKVTDPPCISASVRAIATPNPAWPASGVASVGR